MMSAAIELLGATPPAPLAVLSLDTAADPASGALRILFRLPKREGVAVTLHDRRGHRLARLFSGTPAGGALVEETVPAAVVAAGGCVVWLQTASGESRHLHLTRGAAC